MFFKLKKTKQKRKKVSEATAGRRWFGKVSAYLIVPEAYGKPPGFSEPRLTRWHLNSGSVARLLDLTATERSLSAELCPKGWTWEGAERLIRKRDAEGKGADK